MEALAFFTDYPLRQMAGSDADHNGESRGDGLFLDLGDGNRVSLYPFIVPGICAKCDARETYFIDAWDRKRHIVRMKSFECVHTIDDSEVSDSLAPW
jgi:hypothetical protein